jgi:hypothetical protein
MGAAEVKARAVTPTLFVGGSPTFDYVRCETPTHAYAVLLAGGTVVLPEGAWDVAEETLRLLGIDEAWIENRLTYAQSGILLPTDQ